MSNDGDFNKGDFNKGGIPTLPPVEKSIENYLEVNCKKYAKQVRQLSQAIEEATSKGDSSVTIHFEAMGTPPIEEEEFFKDYLQWLDYKVEIGNPSSLWTPIDPETGGSLRHLFPQPRAYDGRAPDNPGHLPIPLSNIDWQYIRPNLDSIPFIHFREESSICYYKSIEISWGRLNQSRGPNNR
jgi:hypothetical protein